MTIDRPGLRRSTFALVGLAVAVAAGMPASAEARTLRVPVGVSETSHKPFASEPSRCITVVYVNFPDVPGATSYALEYRDAERAGARVTVAPYSGASEFLDPLRAGGQFFPIGWESPGFGACADGLSARITNAAVLVTVPDDASYIRGQVTGADGGPLAGARLRLRGPSPGVVSTDASGTTLRRVRPGRYVVSPVERGRLAPARRNVRVTRGATVTTAFRSTEIEVSGTVTRTDCAGATCDQGPAAGVEIVARRGNSLERVTTGGDGRYELTLARGTWGIAASGQGPWNPRIRSVSRSADDVDFGTCDPGGKTLDAIVANPGLPRCRFRVEADFVGPGGLAASLAGARLEGLSDDGQRIVRRSGRGTSFGATVPPGTYTLTPDVPGGTQVRVRLLGARPSVASGASRRLARTRGDRLTKGLHQRVSSPGRNVRTVDVRYRAAGGPSGARRFERYEDGSPSESLFWREVRVGHPDRPVRPGSPRPDLAPGRIPVLDPYGASRASRGPDYAEWDRRQFLVEDPENPGWYVLWEYLHGEGGEEGEYFDRSTTDVVTIRGTRARARADSDGVEVRVDRDTTLEASVLASCNANPADVGEFEAYYLGSDARDDVIASAETNPFLDRLRSDWRRARVEGLVEGRNPPSVLLTNLGSGDDRAVVGMSDYAVTACGGDGFDELIGSRYGDTLLGEGDNDELDGGRDGRDYLSGGPGRDVCTAVSLGQRFERRGVRFVGCEVRPNRR